jgi:hypothetical protein
VSFHVHPQIITCTGNFVAVRTSEQLPFMALLVDAKNLFILQPESEQQAQQCYMCGSWWGMSLQFQLQYTDCLTVQKQQANMLRQHAQEKAAHLRI